MIPPRVLVGSRQIDLKLFAELFDSRPPVAAKDRDSLEAWVEQSGYKLQSVGDNAALVSFEGFDFKQLWVKKEFENYREQMIKYLSGLYGTDKDYFSDYDADHVVARVRLRSFSDSWIKLFPVRKTWNRYFGAIEEEPEHALTESHFDHGMYYITGFEALKLFAGDLGRIIDAAKQSFAIQNETTSSIREEMEKLRFV